MTIQKIKAGLAKAKALILGNAKNLQKLKGRIRTKAQAAVYAKFVQKQKKQQELYKKIYSKYQTLVAFINKAKAAGQWVKGKITGAARRVRGLFSRKGTRGINDLGIAPLVAAAAAIAALLAAVGYLLKQTVTQKEEIDALNETLDEYENQGEAAPEGETETEEPAEEPESEEGSEEEW